MNPDPTQEPQAAEQPTDTERALMKEHDIARDDTHYVFSGYRYLKLGDALDYARLVRERPELPSRGHALPAGSRCAVPAEAAREPARPPGLDAMVQVAPTVLGPGWRRTPP